jgi:hypothetical protein
MNLPRTLVALLAAGLVATACGDDDGPTTPDTLAAPTAVEVLVTSPTTATVTFNAVAGASGYVVQRAPGGGGAFATVGTPTTTAFDDEGLSPDTPYRYRVAATDGSRQSDFSGEAVAITPEEGPTVAIIENDITSDRTLYADSTRSRASSRWPTGPR